MQKRENYLPIFLIFLFFSIIVFLISQTSLFLNFQSILESSVSPLRSFTYSLTNKNSSFSNDLRIQKLKNDNADLIKKIVDIQILEKENNALKDQFKTTYPPSQNLLSAKIIGVPNFIPNLTMPENFIIDKGQKDGLKVGQAVVYKENLVGKVAKTASNISIVDLITNKAFSVATQTSETGALGVIKGQGSGNMILDNVLLSENLKTSDIVLTKGDIEPIGVGFLPDLVIGKIESIDKKPSALFQTASVKSFLDFSKLSTVFIVLGNE